MHAMIFEAAGRPLVERCVPVPDLGAGQVLVRVRACAVCRTDLHVVDGELPHPKLPLIPGHEIVGTVVRSGPGASRLQAGARVGIPWLGWTCSRCDYCRMDRENLCDEARFTGYTLDGGYAEYVAADERYCFLLPEFYSDTEAAPLLCAGLIGYRCLVHVGPGQRIGLYGFGAAAHIVIQILRFQDRRVYAFTRPQDEAAQEFARRLGAVWAGSSEDSPPEKLDGAILFAPVGSLVPRALEAVRKGGIVVCGGIHMSDIPAFPYRLLWEERVLCSVANLTRRDGIDFFRLAGRIPIRSETRHYSLSQANEALQDLRSGRLQGAAVLIAEGF